MLTNPFNQFSIRNKLIFIIMLTTSITLLIAGIGFITSDVLRLRQELAEDLTSQADIIAYNSAAALIFHDQNSATQTLAACRKNDNIVSACIFDNGSEVFATYARDSLGTPEIFHYQNDDGYFFEKEHLHVYQKVELDNEYLGKLYIKTDLNRINDTIISSMIIGLSLLSLSLVFAYLISSRIQRPISAPIIRLSKTAKKISSGQNFSVRAKKQNDDEIGVLVDSFNEMLDQIQEREITIRSERDHTKGILTASPVIIFGLDRNEKLTFLNPAGESITGYSTDELKLQNWWKTLYPGKEYLQVENLFKIIESTDIRDYEMTLTDKAGSKRIISWNFINKMDSENKLIELIGFGNDVTETKEAALELYRLRNLLSNIVNSMPSVLVGVDKAGIVTQWNREAEKATGVDADGAIGNVLDDVYPQFADEMGKISQAIRDRKIQKDTKLTHLTNNENRYSDVTIYPLIANGVEGAVIRIDDVTERVRIEEMMIQSEKMLSVGGLAAGMAHEINNPLAGILQNVQVIRNRISPELKKNAEAAESCGISIDGLVSYMENRGIYNMIDSVVSSGNRAAQIVENMLNFSRKSESRFAVKDLAELVDKTIELAYNDYSLKKKHDFRQVKIIREYEDNLPKVPCEGSKIQQVILNLLKNGAHAMSDAGMDDKDSKIVIRLTREPDHIRLEMEDNGPGMDESVRKRVFEPFFTTKEVGVGTGLGLSVSYFIIAENHGGTMSVKSKPDAGAIFIIRLPLVAPDNKDKRIL